MILSLLLASTIAVATPAAPSLIVPADVFDNMLFVEVRVNGGAPRSFLLDTAVPTTMLDPRSLQRPATLDIGGLPFTLAEPAAIDLSFFESLEGRRLDGIVGGDVFQKYVVEMDYDAGAVRFHDPASYRYEGTGEVVPITIVGGKPFVSARLKMPDGAVTTRQYLIDSGSAGAVADELFAGAGEGVGPDLGRAEYLEIGSFRFDGANGTSGARKIGGELLKRFNVILDFPRSRMILEPNRHFADALLFDTSGVELEQSGSAIRVAAVHPRTPAADAGMQKDDVIAAIDGQPALTLGLDRIRRLLHQVRTHELTLARGGESSKTTLALRSMLPGAQHTVVATKLAGTMPIFQVRTGGKPLWFLLDTGSPYTFLDTKAAAALGLSAQRTGSVRGAGGGTVPTGIIDGVTFDLAGLRVRHEVRLTDLSGVEALLGHRVDGFFGYDLLARYVVRFEPGRITLTEPARFRRDERDAVLPITFGGKTGRWIYVPATIKVAGREPVTAQFFVDSGSLDGANHPLIRKATSPLRQIGTGRGLGGGGTAGVAGEAEWVRLGPYAASKVPSSCCSALPGTEAQLGQTFLGRFIVTYDYSRKQMMVAPLER